MNIHGKLYKFSTIVNGNLKYWNGRVVMGANGFIDVDFN